MPSKKRVSSSLEEQISEEPMPGLTPQRQIPSSNCPKFCPKFICIIDERYCHEECNNLETVGALICDLCTLDKECTETRKKILLNPQYIQKTTEKNTQQKTLVDSFESVRMHHTHLEMNFREKKDKLLTLKWFEMPLYMSLTNDIKDIEIELKYIRKVMKLMTIEHKEEIVIDQTTPQKKGSNTNILMLIGIVVLVIFWLLSK